jgi:hypothetical protein
VRLAPEKGPPEAPPETQNIASRDQRLDLDVRIENDVAKNVTVLCNFANDRRRSPGADLG